MSLIYAGIDEAGYGPRLGPLCVALCVLRIEQWHPGDPPPNLWRTLARAVCRKPNDKRKRIPIADSKALKLPNGAARHPLTHLERAVLASLDPIPADDAELLSSLGAELTRAPWYDAEPTPLPLANTPESIRLDALQLRRAMDSAGVEVLSLACACIDESAFNQRVRDTGTKAAVVLDQVRTHIARCADEAARRGEALRVVCDRLGGRTHCRTMVAEALAEHVEAVEESARCSRYLAGTHAGVLFVPEAENTHLPVALASMTAKLVRELAMMRFNHYWSRRCPGIRPTAGYWKDASRWLEEMAPLLDDEERRSLVRLA